MNYKLISSFFLIGFILFLGQSGNAAGGTVNATGGTLTVDGDYNVHTFTTNGTFTPDGIFNVSTLLIGGGGAGYRGGGGAGGYLYTTNVSVASQAYSVSVGIGGVSSTSPLSGASSTFNGLIAYGGGFGGGINLNGANGGSGGGGGSTTSSTSGGIGSQGGNGGDVSYSSSPYPAAGGGGASQSGLSVTTSSAAAGGNGTFNNITGTAVIYAGGGGGATHNAGILGDGGDGGGGDGGDTPGSGTDGLGGGGGGATLSGTEVGHGGSGVVIIRYNRSQSDTSPNVYYNVSGYVQDDNNTFLNNVLITNNQTENTTTTNSVGYYNLDYLENGGLAIYGSLAGYTNNDTIVSLAGSDLFNQNFTLVYIVSEPEPVTCTFLYPNSTHSAGYYGRLASELIYGTGFNISDIGTSTPLSSAQLDTLSVDDGNSFGSLDQTASNDGYGYINFSLSGVESVNSIRVRTIHTREGVFPVILGLFNASTQKWIAVNSSSVGNTDVEMTYLISGTDVAKYSSLNNSTLTLSVSLHTNSDGNYDAQAGLFEVCVDYEPFTSYEPIPSYEMLSSTYNVFLVLLGACFILSFPKRGEVTSRDTELQNIIFSFVGTVLAVLLAQIIVSGQVVESFEFASQIYDPLQHYFLYLIAVIMFVIFVLNIVYYLKQRF